MREKNIFRLKRRGIVLICGLLLLIIGVFFLFEWMTINRNYEKKRTGEIRSSETSMKVVDSTLSKELSNIKSIDLFYSEIYRSGVRDISLQDMGTEISALKASLHGILQIRQGEIISYYAHAIEEKQFIKNMERFAGNGDTRNGEIHFFSESYGRTRDFLEVTHTVRIKNSSLVFVYGIDNTYLWHGNSEAEPANRYFIYDIKADKIVPSQISLVDLGKVKEELKNQDDSGTLVFDRGSVNSRLVSYVRFRDGNFYLFNSIPVEPFGTYILRHLQSMLPVYLVFAVVLMLFALFYYLFLFRPVLSIEKAIYGVIHEDINGVPADAHSIFYPIASTINVMMQKIKEMTDREYKERILKKQAELMMLQSQINPHFLYNTLESIRALARREGADDASNMIKALANFFRYTIERKESVVVLREELKNVEDYLTIQNYRFKNKFCYHKEFDENDSQLMECRLIKMMLQPIVENAVYHGLETKTGQGNITIRIIQTQTRLLIIIKDDGIGIPPTQLKELNERIIADDISQEGDKRKHGVALINVNQRIQLYFGSEYGLNIYSKEGMGTDVEVALPLVHNKTE